MAKKSTSTSKNGKSDKKPLTEGRKVPKPPTKKK